MEPAHFPNVTSMEQPPEADQLRQIAADIETYLSKWLVRTRRVIEHSRGNTTDDLTVSSQMKKFEETRRKWEARQQREMEDIAEKANELKTAWLKLEAEQREFLRMKESWQRRGGPSAQVVVDPPVSMPTPENETPVQVVAAEVAQSTPTTSIPTASIPTASMPTAVRSGPPVAPRSPLAANVIGRGSGCGNTYDSAIRQFQQLRREVGVRHVPQ